MIAGIDGLTLEERKARLWQTLASASGDQPEARKKVAQEFAAVLFLEAMKTMRATIPQGGLFGQDSSSNEIYTTLVDMELARAMAKREAIGLEGLIEKALDSYARRSGSPGADTLRPADGVIKSLFGARADPLTGEKRFHKGIDIAAPAGSPIRAAASGTVTYSDRANGYGNMVVVDHGDGLVTRYAHNQMNLVSAGDPVQAGQEIALVGSTGRSTGPHLHFEVLKRGDAVDPLKWVTASGKNPDALSFKKGTV